jgi:antitoxin ParD1/3/4
MSDSLIYDMSLGSEETEVPFLSKQLIYINDNNASKQYSTHEIIWDSLSIGSNGKYNSASEVIRTALRLLEEEEEMKNMLRKALVTGEKSGFVENFDPKKHLASLHKRVKA